MPNWCDNNIEIFAKEETIDWIGKNIIENSGRREDGGIIEKNFLFVEGNDVWFSLYIFMRTSGTGLLDFIKLILKKYKNIHIKWRYWIELGCGAGEYEMGTDNEGKEYENFNRIDQSYECDIVYDKYEIEICHGEELAFDQLRVDNPWYGILRNQGYTIRNIEDFKKAMNNYHYF